MASANSLLRLYEVEILQRCITCFLYGTILQEHMIDQYYYV